MLKKVSIILICFIGVLLLFFILFLCANESILRSEKKGILGALALLTELFNSPKDLFTPLVKEQIDISKKGNKAEFVFKHKYAGRHNINIGVEKKKLNLYIKKYGRKTSLVLDIGFYIEKKRAFSLTTYKKHRGVFYGREQGGFCLAIYNCPENLPMDKNIVCKITVIEPDLDLVNICGPVTFYVKKLSDL